MFLLRTLLLCFVAAALSQVDLDLPDVPPNIQTIATGSLIIPMDSTYQSTKTRTFNFYAYGAVVSLLTNNITVMWAINSQKEFQGIDFVAPTTPLLPTEDSKITTRSFMAGPFIVRSVDAPRAKTVLANWGKGVAVYALAASTQIDIRYTLAQRPFVGVMDSSGFNTILVAYLNLAGLVKDVHYRILSYQEAASANSETCLTMLTEPHFVPSGNPTASSQPFVQAMRSFVNSGGNFLAECAGIATYEQCYQRPSTSLPQKSQCPDGFFLTTNGLYCPSAFSWPRTLDTKGPFNVSATSPYTQFDKPFVPDNGFIGVFDLFKQEKDGLTSTWLPNSGGYFAVTTEDKSSYGRGTVAHAAHGKIPSFFGKQGGNIFWLAGHDFGQDLLESGIRMFLNAMFVPAHRPASCGFSDGFVLPPVQCAATSGRPICDGLSCHPNALATTTLTSPFSSITTSFLCSTTTHNIIDQANGNSIGSATTQWEGESLLVSWTLTSGYCWNSYRAYASPTSIESIYSNFQSVSWLQGSSSACSVSGSTLLKIKSSSAWTVTPGCDDPFYLALNLDVTGPSTRQAWLVPANSNLGTNQRDGDGVSTVFQGCDGECYRRTYSVTCNGDSLQCGQLDISISGSILTYSLTTINSWTLKQVDIFVSQKSPPPVPISDPSSSFTFRYGVPGCVPSASSVSASLQSSVFTFTMDLSVPLKGPGGTCGTQTYQPIACASCFAWAVRVTADAGPASQVSLGSYTGWAAGSSQLAGSSTRRPLPDDQWGFYETVTRCCNKPTPSIKCLTNQTCIKVVEFTDDLKWNALGTEVVIPYCCPDTSLDLLVKTKIFPGGGVVPFAGYQSNNIALTCQSGQCFVNVTFISARDSSPNSIGGYLVDSGGVLGDQCVIIPDTHCAQVGDTYKVGPVTVGTPMGLFLQVDGKTPSWFSFLTSAITNSDSARHFSWMKIDQTDLILVGVETTSSLGEQAYNGGVFALQLIGDWVTTNIITYQPCSDTVLTCRTFDPSEHSQYIFSPGCGPTLPLDPGVGSSTKECKGYYSIPKGWSVAVASDDVQATITNYAGTWEEECIVSAASQDQDVSVNFVGRTRTGSSCTVRMLTIPDPKNPGSLCYNLGCDGFLLLESDTPTENCNPLTDGQYCDPTKGSISYQASASSSTYFLQLAGSSYSLPFSVPLRARLNVAVMMDVFSTQATDLASVLETMPFGFDLGTFTNRALGLYYTTQQAPRFYSTCQSLTYTRSDMTSAVSPTPDTLSGTSNILQSLTAFIQDTAIAWTTSTPRSVYVITKAPFDQAQVTQFKAAMSSSGVIVIFVVTNSGLQSSYQTMISGIPRTAVVSASYPNTRLCAIPSCFSAQANWLDVAFQASKPFLGQLTLSGNSPFISSIPPPVTVNGFGTTVLPDVQYYQTNPVVFSLPVNPPQTIPLSVELTVLETSQKIKALLSWNIAPSSPPSVSATFLSNEPGPHTVTLVSSTAGSDPNKNLLDIVFLSQTSSGGAWVNSISVTFGSQTFPFELNKRFPSLSSLSIDPIYTAPSGSVTITYALTDGCLQSQPASVTLTFVTTDPPPNAQPIVVSLGYEESGVIDFSSYISDAKTPLSKLQIAIETNLVQQFGSLFLGTSVGTEISYNTPMPNSQIMYFQPLSAMTGTGEWTYSVHNQAGLSASSTLTVIIDPPSIPVVYFEPLDVTTPYDIKDTFSVTISDKPGLTDNLYFASSSLIQFEYISSSTYFGIQPSSFNSAPVVLSDKSGLLISNIRIPQSGSVTLQMQWQPLHLTPPLYRHTLSVYVVNSQQQTSQYASVTLGVPPVPPPVFKGTPDRTSYPMGTPFDFRVVGDSPDSYSTEILTLTLSSLPTGGSLSINGKPVVVNQSYPVSNSVTVGGSGETTFLFTFTPNFRFSGVDSLSGYFTDRWSQKSNVGTIPITITFVPTPPTVIDIDATATMNVPLPLYLQADSADNNIISLKILSVNLHADTRVTYQNTNLLDLPSLPVVGGLFQWELEYLTSNYEEAIDTITYQALDSNSLTSRVGTATIRVPLQATKPQCWGDSFTIVQDTHLTITFVFGNRDTSGVGNFWNYDNQPGNVYITITSFPSHGTLSLLDGRTITAGASQLPTSQTNPQVVFTPGPGKRASVEFTFTVTNGQSLTSSPATMTINITPVYPPPLLSITPSFQSTRRTSPVVLNISTSCADFDRIQVFVSSSSVPLTEATLTNRASGVVYSSSNALTTGTVLFNTLSSQSGWFEMSWLPSALCPDLSSGTLTLWAAPVVLPSLVSSFASASVSVLLNNNPYVIGSYRVSVNQGTPSASLLLSVSDPDSWDISTLRYTFDSLPHPSIVLSSKTISPLIKGTEYLGAQSGPLNNLPLGIQFTDPSYFGSTTCTFFAKDQLGARSPIAVVNIVVNWVNQRPSSANTQLTVPEDFCAVMPFCQVDPLISVQIPVSDVDSASVNLIWNFTSNALGQLYTYAPGSTSTTVPADPNLRYSNLTGLTFFFQPTPGMASTGCDQSGQGCKPFTTFTYYVQDNSGLNSLTTYTLTVYVTPIPHPPSGKDQNATAVRDTPLPFTVTGVDVDKNLDRMVVTSTNFGLQSSLKDSLGNAVVVGQPLSILPTGSGSFNFVYTYSGPSARVDSFRFVFKDTTNLTSPEYKFTFTTPALPYVPIAAGSSFNTVENVPVPIVFQWPTNYFDSHYLQSQVRIKITSLPSEGNLFTSASSAPITANTVIVGTTVTWVPQSFSVTPVSFDFLVINPEGEVSNTATMSITVTPGFFPPTVKLSPDSVTVPRLTPGIFTITGSALNAVAIQIFSTNVALPFTHSDFGVGSQIYTSSTPLSNDVLLGTLVKTSTGWSNLTVSWTPRTTAPDSTTGSFGIYGLTSVRSTTQPQASVAVTPNKAPSVFVPSSSSYHVAQNEQTVQSTVSIDLFGDDPDAWHTTVLKIVLVDLPTGVVSLSETGVTTTVTSGYTLVNSFGSAGKTQGSVTLTFPPLWDGSGSFSFLVEDLLGARSKPYLVTYTVKNVPFPPSSSNYQLSVPESSCGSSASCTLDLSQSVTISAIDIDSNEVSLVWETLPSFLQGDLYQQVFGSPSQNSKLSTLLPLSNVSTALTFWFQPTPSKASTNCPACDPFVVLPFHFVDSDGISSSQYTLTIFVTPIPHAPTSNSVYARATSGVPVVVSITGSDIDLNVNSFTITAINLNAAATLTEQGSLASVGLGSTFTFTATDSQTLNFEYLFSGIGETEDTFKFIFTDTTNLNSTEYIAVIEATTILRFPEASGKTVQTNENTPVRIPLSWGNITQFPGSFNYWDNYYVQEKVNIKITQLPLSGTLFTTSGTLVAQNTILPSNEVVWEPLVNSADGVTFQFVAVNIQGSVSNVATITINVIAIDYPSSISISPSSLKLARLDSSNFTVKVSNVKATTISIYATDVTVPFEYSTLTIGNTVYTSSHPLQNGDLIGQVSRTSSSVPFPELQMEWAPSVSMPDDSTGGFTLFATSGANVMSVNNVTGSVAVLPNIKPVAQGTSISRSRSTLSQTVVFDITGTDLDTYDSTTLTFVIESLPSVSLTQTGSTTPLLEGSVLSNSAPGTASTISSLTVVIPPSYFGETSFRFHVVDSLGLESSFATVFINVDFVPWVPTSSNYTITIPEDFCAASPCVVDSSTGVHIEAITDVVVSSFNVYFGVVDVTKGALYNLASPSVVSQIPSSGPFNNVSDSLQFWFQPQPSTSSTGCSSAEGCSVFALVPFNVVDSALQPSETYYITVYVVPIPHKPESESLQFNTVRFAEMNIDIPASDVDGNLVSLTLVSFTSWTAESFLTFGGVPVTLGQTFELANPSLSGLFSFTYLYTGYSSNTDRFNFLVSDNTLLNSTEYFVSFTSPSLLYVPEARSSSLSTVEGVPVSFTLTWGPVDNYYDSHFSQAEVSLIPQSLPSAGTLTTSTGVPVLVGQAMPASLIWIPGSTYVTSVSFEFKAENPDRQSSANATISITVTPLDKAPTITLLPPVISVPRLETNYFTVLVGDTDSNTLTVFAGPHSIPFSHSFLTVNSSTIYTSATPLIAGTALATLSKDSSGQFPPLLIGWSPLATAPDSLTGKFIVYAEDSTALSSARPEGTVTVVPNEPPSVVVPSSTYYTPSVDESTTAQTISLTLIGEDPNSWDTTVLKFHVTSVKGLEVFEKGSSVPLKKGSVLSKSFPNTNHTDAIISFRVPAFYSGKTTLSFYVEDTLGLVSAPQLVTFTVNAVNQPPESGDHLLVVFENQCNTAPCQPTSTISVVATDIDSSLFTVVFPNPLASAGYGELTLLSRKDFYPVNYSSTISGRGPWIFSFTPAFGQVSTGCDYSSVTGDTCDPLVIIPFYVHDGNLPSTTHQITIKVIPVAKPPTGENIFITTTNLVPTPVVIPTRDPQNLSTTIIFESVNLTNSILTCLGESVVVGKSYPGSILNCTYTHDSFSSTTDTVTYKVINTANLTSVEVYTIKVNVARTLFAPVVWGSTKKVTENSFVPIHLRWGDNDANPSPNKNYYDFDGTQETTTLFLTRLPQSGTLSTTTGSLLAVGSIIPRGVLVYTPERDSVATRSFEFNAKDLDGLQSNTAAVTIKVIPLPIPPTLSINPSEYNSTRGADPVFVKVTARDTDSSVIEVFFSFVNVPFTYSSLTIYDETKSEITTFTSDPSLEVKVITLKYASTDQIGTPLSFFVGWKVGLMTPDGTTASFGFRAGDDQQGFSNVVQTLSGVVPNNPPFVVSDGDPFTFTAVQGQWSSETVTLIGGDPESYHNTILTIVILSVPRGLNLTNTKGQVLQPGDILQTVPGSDGNTTEADVVLKSSDFVGVTSFSFQVKDPLNAQSEIAFFSITIIAQHLPPVTKNSSLAVDENTCYDSCSGTPTSLSRFDPASITGTADGGSLSLTFAERIPSNLGILFYKSGNKLIPVTKDPIFQTSSWTFWFQPARNKKSANCEVDTPEKCSPYLVVPFFVTDDQGNTSAYSYLTITVNPINYPPSSKSITVKIPMNSPRTLLRWSDDDDSTKFDRLFVSDRNDESQTVRAFTAGILSGSQGIFSTSQGVEIGATDNILLPSRRIYYTPPPWVSNPSAPLATLQFYVEDPHKASSSTYEVRVIVTPVIYPPVWLGPRSSVVLENSVVTIPLNVSSFYECNNTGASIYFTINSVGRGYFQQCLTEVSAGSQTETTSCVNITNSSLPFPLTTGSVVYRPLAYEHGDAYSHFDFILSCTAKPSQINTPRTSVTVHYTINVTHVDQPPVLKGHFHPNSTGPLINWMIEDTYHIFTLSASDRDTDRESLSCETLGYLEQYQASLYGCLPDSDARQRACQNCSCAQYLHKPQKIYPVAPGVWNVSVIPALNFNGQLSMGYVAYDGKLFSETIVSHLTVYPINDAPSIVAGSVRLRNEYYRISPQGKWVLEGSDDKTQFTVKEGDSQEERRLENTYSYLSSQASHVSHVASAPNGTVQTARLFCAVQDIDFFFGYNLSMSAQLHEAEWAKPLIQGPGYSDFCQFPDSTTAFCTGEVVAFNGFLSGGLPLIVNPNASYGWGLFTLNDHGNIDWWERPLNASFVITFVVPKVPVVVAGIPIAVIAVVPVVAVAATALVLGAWLAAGQQAATVVNVYFDKAEAGLGPAAFENPMHQTGTIHVSNSLYAAGVPH